LQYKDKNAFNLANKISFYSQKTNLNEINDIINDFETFTFGTQTIIYNSKKELKNTFTKIVSLIKYPLFKVGNNFVTPLDLILFIVIVFLGWFIGKHYKRLVYSIRKKYNISYSNATLLANMGYYTILAFCIISVIFNFIPVLNFYAPAFGILSIFHYVMEKKEDRLNLA
jgi:potassium efflux system protein